MVVKMVDERFAELLRTKRNRKVLRLEGFDGGFSERYLWFPGGGE